MTESELMNKIRYRMPGTDEKERLLYGIRDYNSNNVYLTITDSVLFNMENEVHVFEHPKVLLKYKDTVSHIIYTGTERHIEALDRFINAVTWKRLRDLDVRPPLTTDLSSVDITCTTYLSAKLKDLSLLKKLTLRYFYGHTMIWLDHEHKKVPWEAYEGGLIKDLRLRDYFKKNKFSIKSKISVPRKGDTVVIEDEEFICSPLGRKTGVVGTSLFSNTTYAFRFNQVHYSLIIRPQENRTYFEPIYDTVIYYSRDLKHVDMENLKKCQALAKNRVIILINDDEERKKLLSFEVLNV